MNLETWNVKIKVDTSQVSNASKTVKNSFNTMTAGSEATAQSLNELKKTLGNLNKINLGNLVFSWKSFAKTLDRISPKLGKTVSELKGLVKAMNTKSSGALFNPLNYGTILIGEGELTRLEALKRNLSEIGKRLVAVANNIKPLIVLLGKLAIVIGTIKSVVWQIKTAINTAAIGDDIKDQAQKVYLSTTAYQEWGYVLAQNGIEIKSLKTLMRTFSKNVATNEAVLKKYNITADNVSESFEQAVSLIQNLNSETEKIAVATELFGNRAAELMPIFNMTNADTKQLLDTYRAIGGTMSNEMLDASDKLTDSITEMKAAFQGLKNALAVGLMPIITQVVQSLTMLFAKITIVVKAILGIEETFSSTDSVSSTLSSNIDDAAESAKKLKKTLLGIDELNVFQSSDTDATATDYDYDIGTDLGTIDTSMLEKLSDFKDKIDSMKEDLQKAVPILTTIAGLTIAVICGLSGNIFGVLAGLSLAAIGITIGATNGTWDDLVQSVKDTVAEIKGPGLMAVGLLLALICGLTGNIPGMVIGLGMAAVGLGITAVNDQWDELKSGIKNVVNDILPAVMEGVGLALVLIGCLTANPILFAAGAALSIAGLIGLNGGWSNGWNELVSGFKEALNKVGTFIKEKVLIYFTASYWTEKWNQIKTGWNNGIANVKNTLTTWWNNIKSWFTSTVAPVFTTAYWANKFSQVISSVNTKMSEIKSALSMKYAEIKSWFATTVAPVFTSSFWLSKWDTIKTSVSTKMSEIRTTISTSWATIKSWFSTNIATIFTASYWNAKFTSMKTAVTNGIKSVINALISKIETGINSIATKINSSGVISGINKVTGWNLSFKTISIPRLANGGVLRAPTVAQLGEYPGARTNPEIAAPQSVLNETIQANNSALINAFAQMTRQIISAIEDNQMEVSIGDDVIAKAASRGNKSYKRITGTALI